MIMSSAAVTRDEMDALQEAGESPDHEIRLSDIRTSARSRLSLASYASRPVRGLVIGVLTGGGSRERGRSFMSGQAVAEALEATGHVVVVLDTAAAEFTTRVVCIDIAFLAIAGQYAEDGRLQGFLETLSIPYTGSGVLASALGMHKPTAKTVVAAAGVRVLPHVVLDVRDRRAPADMTEEVAAEVGLPCVLKPASEGGSNGVAIARDAEALTRLIASDDLRRDGLFVEPFVTGRIVTVGVLEVRGEPVALPPLEVATVRDFYDGESKADAALCDYRCPAPLSPAARAAVSASAIRAHCALGCVGHSRSDFVLDTDLRPWWLEINTLPGLSRTGNLSRMAEAAGISHTELVHHILDAARAAAPGYRP
jgi:D-alanine-D-alanine ligase